MEYNTNPSSTRKKKRPLPVRRNPRRGSSRKPPLNLNATLPRTTQFDDDDDVATVSPKKKKKKRKMKSNNGKRCEEKNNSNNHQEAK